MSLEDDFIAAQKELQAAQAELTSFVGTVTSIDPVQVIMDGTSVPLPCIALDDVNLFAGKKVVVSKYGSQYVIMGALGNRVVNFPAYTVDPSATNPGDSWYRSDLAQAFMNIAGVATPLGGGGSVVSAALTAAANYGTSATQITDLDVELDVGTWVIKANYPWDYVGTTDEFFSIAFTGTAANNNFNANRNVGTANAYMPDITFGGAEQNMGQTHDQVIDMSGIAVVTAIGTMQSFFRRAAGTSGTVKVGASVLAIKVA